MVKRLVNLFSKILKTTRRRMMVGDKMVDIPDDYDDGIEEEDNCQEDEFNSAVRMAFIGAGQGGGRLAQSFYDLGYRRVCAINTTDQDLAPLALDNKLVVGNNRGGAGKDPQQGKLAARESYEDIMDLMMRSWGENVEQIYVCVGAGGGSGTGSWEVLVDAARDYCESTNVEKPVEQHLGVIMTLPKRSEGSRVQANAYASVKRALEMVEAKAISSLVIVDNAKIHELYPRLSVKKFWPIANKNFAAVFHTFNLLASQSSNYNTFDRADFRSVIRNGIMIFGMTRVTEYSGKEDISKAVRQNLRGTLLGDGFNLSSANMAAAIVVAHDDVLSDIPMENIDYAFNSLGRLLGNEGITLHNGIYEGRGDGMRVFTLISGLEKPQSRLDELKSLSR
jgi:cell division GTPase FtsZ